MQPIETTADLNSYRRALVSAIKSPDSRVFLDTNVLAWGFRLGEDAFSELARWLDELAAYDRLVIPAWVVHEYNVRVIEDDARFFSPHRGIGQQLKVGLTNIDRLLHMTVSERSAKEAGFSDRASMLAGWDTSTAVIEKCLGQLKRDDLRKKEHVLGYLADLISKCASKADVHRLIEGAARVGPVRYANRLSPGYEDASKGTNSYGDLVIWLELLEHCQSFKVSRAVFLTDDGKSDWVYTPANILLPSGKSIPSSNHLARQVRLPRPDLVSEFEMHTGSSLLSIFSMEGLIEALSDAELNGETSQEFRKLAKAIRIDPSKTPTGAVIEWLLNNPDKYKAAINGVANWQHSPSEVDQDALARWTAEQIGNITITEVDWSAVFCQLFL